MVKRRDPVLEQNKTIVTLADFLTAYNKSSPEGFPRATAAVLRKFQAVHPTLFKHGDNWSIEKHRKKLMDWLPSYQNA
ncbi:hypothetical protein A3I36_00395 [Candidatus Giovannonibacteria bacterium RIFCSPLOWO2_02_FULL_45_28]|uniref:Uncharacterized protein n=1 Tax=Candidatus Giovannonibacteria bacterium RIFCSPHIGHO2_02_FULL_45_40 TaxID=1798337 RepID=A0A1F5WBF4_9BACT|nr:MAG: hypothetical protein UX43_C0015G0008 [Candidatus Giovannonibacteria bacterium GW2011_GWB1_46_20]OGF49007.1 MAG: hypothetical protein A2120_00750 [Candidatus Giovannonibacteria bacterium GWA2_45_15]OGF72989.1 MAG: hypothetical protein A3C05_03350 [Candidatus Giovannonibacteria bacterium RIFCSPHIGHO2_02_FULL_45_40]OGF84118.1 MAG: hypothetical protein A3E63_05085 [Candidatus Giovannonibacteria bacterium RIFCSPHIGHO2_12_FULL_45_19]OGF87178.1 MAG: hypothetical protein A3I36_00395 [Candidatus